jgi:hypothetical protein
VVGDHRQRAAPDQPAAERIAVVGGIGGQDPGRGERFEQGRCQRDIVPLPGAQREGERPAVAIDDGMDLGRPTAA